MVQRSLFALQEPAGQLAAAALPVVGCASEGADTKGASQGCTSLGQFFGLALFHALPAVFTGWSTFAAAHWHAWFTFFLTASVADGNTRFTFFLATAVTDRDAWLTVVSTAFVANWDTGLTFLRQDRGFGGTGGAGLLDLLAFYLKGDSDFALPVTSFAIDVAGSRSGEGLLLAVTVVVGVADNFDIFAFHFGGNGVLVGVASVFLEGRNELGAFHNHWYFLRFDLKLFATKVGDRSFFLDTVNLDDYRCVNGVGTIFGGGEFKGFVGAALFADDAF